jgi:hypothetical protein
MLVIRGTADTFKFKLPCKNTELDWVKIHFNQVKNPISTLPIVKELNDCGPRNESNQLDGSNILLVSLTPYDTVQFSDKYKATMHMLAKQTNGLDFGVSEYLITVYSMPDDIIDANPIIPPTNSESWIVLDGESIV